MKEILQYPEFLGEYHAWGAYDVPSNNEYHEELDNIGNTGYGREDDPAGANAGPGGGCDGGEGGCPAGAAHAGAPNAGDPVNTVTGNKYVEETDNTDDEWLRFRRFYNSDAATSSSAMGMRWSHSFNRHLARVTLYTGTISITVSRPTGLRELFHKTDTGSWTATANNADILTESVDTQGATTGYTLWIAALRHTETYSTDGRLLTIRNETGQTATLAYSDSATPRAIAPQSGLLLTVTAPNRRALSLTYDASARIHQLTLPDGGSFTYDYDYPGNLSTVTYPDGKKRQYVYNESALTGGANFPYVMTGLIDENGVRLETTSYDPNTARALSTESAGGAGRVAIQYNADGSSDVTYPLTGTSHQTYTTVQQLFRIGTLDKPCGECGQPYAARTYDANSRPATTTDFNGNVVGYTYDANGLLTQRIDAKGSADQRTTDTTWNTTMRTPLVRTVKDTNGNLVSKQGWAYNANGQETATCAIDPVAAPSYVCSASGPAPVGVRRTVSTYCNAIDSTTCPLPGLLLSTDGPRSDVQDVTTYSYYLTTDESGCTTIGGNCHHLGDLKSVTDAAGLVTTYVSYDRSGRVTRQRGPNGVLTDTTYTPRGWLATTTVRADPSGSPSAQDAVTMVAYDPSGTVHQVTDPDGVSITYTYDAAHRLTDITDALGNRTHYTLDAAGNKTTEQVLTPTGTVVRSASRTFNPLGQLTALKDGLNHTTFSASFTDSYDANGNLVHSQDALGVQQKQVFDGLERLVSTIQDYQGSNTATANTQSVTRYDARDRVIGFSDPDGLNTTYDIDALGNLTGVHSPDTGTTTHGFDISGNAVSSVDATHVSTASTFDAAGRLTGTTYADTSLNVQYLYDEADTATGCTGGFGKGHLTRIVEGNGGLVYCYDRRGNVVRKQQTIGTATTTTGYTWTLGNRLASITTANGTRVAYTRDANGRIASVTATPSASTATTVASNVIYQPFGPVTSYKLGNGQTVTRTYDANGQLTDIASAAFSWHVARDAMGNIAALGNTTGASPATETYGYDPLYRLSGVDDATGSAIEAYTYNKTGDRLSKAAPGMLTGAYSYKSGTHQLVGVGTTTRQVDPRGNTTANVLASGTYGFGYNQRNRLTVVQNGGTTVGAYVLNALGQRVQKTAHGSTTLFDYDETSGLVSESTGSSTRDYVWMDGLPIGIVDREGTTATVSYVHADGLGTPRAVTDATGAMKWQWAYAANPFGEKSPVSSVGYTLNLRFPGQYFDAESGLNYNVYRDYEAAAGRYIQSDPIGLDGGMNIYGYVGSSPLMAIDSLGLQAVPAPGTSPGFPGAPGIGQVPGYGPPANDPLPPPNAGGLAAVCGRALGAVALALWPNSTSGCDQPAPPDDNQCPGGDACETAKRNARDIYWKLVSKRIPQFQSGGVRGRDPKHFDSLLQLQQALRKAISRVRYHCRKLPPEIGEWEMAANLNAPGF